MTGRRSVAGVDLAWRGEVVVVAAGPLVAPTRADLAHAVVELAGRPATARLGWVLDASGRRWLAPQDRDEHLRRCVHELPPQTDRPALIMAAAAIDLGAAPFAFVISGDHVVLAVDHVIGDGYFITRLLAAAIELATGGERPGWLDREPVHRPLTRALWQQFGRDPRRLRALVEHARRHRAAAPAPETAAVPGRPWTPSPDCRIRSTDRAALRELKAWRREHAPGVSTIPLAIAAADLARRAVGVPAVAAPLVLFDARRHLRPHGADITGNFCAGLRLDVTDPGDPVAVDDAIKHAAALGRPLAVTAAAAFAARRTRSRQDAQAAGSGDGWDVAYTHMGKPPELARLTRAGGERAAYFGLLPPSGPRGVTFAMSEIGEHLNVSVSFHRNEVDARLVDAVLDELVGDPVGLLDRYRTTARAVAPT